MNRQEKISWMESCKGKNHPLSQFRTLLDRHLPEHKNLEKIQVAGTNGKGSTTLWMAKLLEKTGFKTGIFTSPHLVEHYERISINGVPIPAKEWERIFDDWSALFKKEQFTMFEMDLWMALAWFIEQDVDLAFMECGMGGRLDATTALDYKANIITSVGLDHMEYLGNSKAAIAREKAGVFKPGIPAFTAEDDPAILHLLARLAKEKGTVLYRARPKMKQSEYDLFMPYRSNYLHFDLMRLPLYQVQNFNLAFQTLKSLEYPLEPEDVQAVIDEFLWPGRFHQISAEPYILVDGAHNVQGISSLVNSLAVFTGDIFFSCLADKQSDEMIEKLKELEGRIILVDFETGRKANLTTLAKRKNLQLISFDEMMENLKTRREAALVCGSLYFVGDVLKEWNEA